VTINFLR